MVTATAAAADFLGLLDEVERGETVVITRDGVPVARLVSDRRSSAERLADLLKDHPADDNFSDDLDAVRADMRRLSDEDLSAEPDAWTYDENGAIRIVGTDKKVTARPSDRSRGAGG
jgi:prevent-host-death family protein